MGPGGHSPYTGRLSSWLWYHLHGLPLACCSRGQGSPDPSGMDIIVPKRLTDIESYSVVQVDPDVSVPVNLCSDPGALWNLWTCSVRSVFSHFCLP